MSSSCRTMRRYLGRLPRTPSRVAVLLTARLSLYLNSSVGNLRTGVFIADSKYSGTCRCALTPSVTATSSCPAASAISFTAIACVMCPRPSPSTQNIIFMEINQLDLAVKIFHQRGAAFHPIAAVQIFHAVDHLQHSAVDVAADDAVGDLLARHLRRACPRIP